MRRFLFGLAMVGGAALAGVLSAQSAKLFTLQQILSAPYALGLTASPVGAEFAWIENAEGVRNIWVGGPHEPARRITHYSADDAQDINGLAWSPLGNAVAYAYGAEAGANGKPANPAHLQRPTPVEVWVQDVTNGSAVDLGEGHSPQFTRDGEAVIFVRAGQIWISSLHPKQAPARQMVIDRGSASGITTSPKGKTLAFVSRRKGHSFIGLFDDSLRFIAPSTGRDSAPSFSPDGTKIAWLRAPFTEAPEFAANRLSANPWSVMVADVATPDAAKAVFTAAANKPGSVLPHLATGDPRVFWLDDERIAFFSESDGWVHLYAVKAEAAGSRGKPVLLTPGNGEVEDVAQGPRGALMWSSNVPVCEKVGYTTGNAPIGGTMACDTLDEDRRHVWKLDDGNAVALTSGEGIEVKPQIAGDGSIAALVSDATVPMHPASLANDGTATSLREGEWPKQFPKVAVELLKPQQVLIPQAGVAPKGVAKKDVRVSLHGQLFLPAYSAAKVHPALIFFHGGPMREMLLGYPAMEYYSNAYAMNQYLASRGFVVLSVNYHCGIGYGMDFRQCVHAGADGASEYADVLAAVKWLRARKDVDAKRIGIWGGSYGGYLTALALARNSDLFAAGVDFHGVHDWILEDNNADWLRGSYAQKDAIAKVAHASSPMADIAKWHSPVLLIHGDNDANVAYNQTPVLADALRAHGVPVEELIFPDEIHEFLLHKDWLKAYGAEAEFFERVLKPE